MSQSMLLDQASFDLTTDLSGNWALCDEPYSSAQDAMCAIRLFQGELYYDDTQGIPYFSQILGRLPPISYLKQQFAKAALTVPGVSSAIVYLDSFVNRQLAGQCILTLSSGVTAVLGIGGGLGGPTQFYLGSSTLGGDDWI